MLRLKNFVAIMVVALAATFGAPQAFAGEILTPPGVAGDMSCPGLAGDMLTPPGVAGNMPIIGDNGEMDTPGVNGEMQNGITGEMGSPGLGGQMEFPIAGGIWALIAGLF